jgi:NADH:ubiquinone oxidoreductase subunit E
VEKERMDHVISKYPETKGNLIGMLHEIQNEFRYLPEEELRYLSLRINVPMTQIYSIAHFYNRFSLTPKGENEVSVCLGTACHVKGGKRILDEVRRKLKIDEGQTTKDMKFSLEVVRCVGACSLAPCVVVNNETHRQVTSEQVTEIIDHYR